MREIKFEESHPLPTEQQLCDFEAEFNIKLPRAYSRFLLKQGGGVVCGQNKVIAIRSLKNIFEPEPVGVERIYSIVPGDDDWSGLARNLVAYRECEYVVVGDPEEVVRRNPDEFIPVADDGCGGEYCIGIKGSVYGKVYIYSTDGGVEGLKAHPEFGEFFYLARSFPAFLRKLKSEEKF